MTNVNHNAEESAEPRASQFPSTHWSVVLAAGRADAPGAQEALESLCRTYWQPIYAYIRRRGHDPVEAQDLTQEFFAWLLEKKAVAKANAAYGKFRTFLLTLLNHFLVDQHRKTMRQKRGGGQAVLSLQAQAAEQGYNAEPVDQLSPEKLFEKRWAVALIEQVLSLLRAEYVSAGKGALFDGLKGYIWGCDATPRYVELAMRLGMSESALKVSVYRLRQRCRQLLRLQVAQTVARPEQVDEELRYLLAVFSS
jgi:RNA polymerase sigma factor (sigma-70 family)